MDLGGWLQSIGLDTSAIHKPTKMTPNSAVRASWRGLFCIAVQKTVQVWSEIKIAIFAILFIAVTSAAILREFT
jgi:hypothetical protein